MAGSGGLAGRGHGVLRGTVRAVRGDVALCTALVMAHQAAEASVPVVIGVIVDGAIGSGDASSLVRWIGVLAVLFAGLSSAGCVGVYVYDRIEARADHAVRVGIVQRVLAARGGTDAVARPGEVVSLATVDSLRIAEGVCHVAIGAGAVVGIGVAAVVLFTASVRLGFMVLLGLPAVLVAIHLLSRPLERRTEAQFDAVASASGVAADLLAGLRVLKGLGAEEAGGSRYRAASRVALSGALRTAQARGAFEGLTLALSGVFLVAVAWVGGRMAASGRMTLGELVAALGLTQFLVGPLTRAAYTGVSLARARASARRVEQLLRAPAAVEEGGGRLPEPVRGRLTVRGLCTDSLDDLDLDVEPGELVGLVVPDHADAVALLTCLGRTADPHSGEIAVDGVPLPELLLEESRRAVLVVPHDAELFEGSLADNVAVAATGDVSTAMIASAADEVAGTLPAGAGTPMVEGGRSLSGGQRQRVALARALAADPPVLVLDEPTTAVDAATEHRIASRLREVRAGRTTLIVTTSPALLAVADRVVVLESGAVAAEGTHRTLAAADERYRAVVLS